MMKKVFLLYPLSGNINDNFDHIGLGYIASNLQKNNIEVEILNLPQNDIRLSEIKQKILIESPLIVGVSVINDTIKQANNFVEDLRKNNLMCHVCFGGYYPTFYDKEVLQEGIVDSVIRFEGETAFLQLTQRIFAGEDWHTVNNLSYMAGNEIHRNPLAPYCNLDSLPNPYRPNLTQVRDDSYNVYISTSRGCFGNCMYCSIQSFYRLAEIPRWRGRSPESVVNEIEELWNVYRAKRFIIIDDDFIPPSKEGVERAKEIARLLIKKSLPIVFFITCNALVVEEDLFALLRKAGLRMVSLGIESSDAEILKKMQKATTVEKSQNAINILNKLNLAIDFGMIFFNPFTTLSTLRSDLSLMHLFGSYKPNIIPVNLMKLRRGTPGYEMMIKEGCTENEFGEIAWEFKDECVKRVYDLFWKVFVTKTNAVDRINSIIKNAPNVFINIKKHLKNNNNIIEEIFQEIRELTISVALGIIDYVEQCKCLDSETCEYYSQLITNKISDIEDKVKYSISEQSNL